MADAFTEEAWFVFLDDIINNHAATSERKQDRSKKREQEIIRSAICVFAREGISRARISDIAAEAGMPVSTIYEYFNGKEDIAFAVPIIHLRRFFQEFKEITRTKKSAYDRLWHYLRLAADFARRNPEWARALYLEIWPSVAVNESPVQTSFDDYVRIIVYLLKWGEADGEWPAGPNYYETAAILVGAINQIIITWSLYRRPNDLTKAASAVATRTMQLLNPVNRAGV